MIPILYGTAETVFTSNGIGRLSECISCLVTEERNGKYEVEFRYPITGKYYHDIDIGTIISVTHDEQGDRQPFIVYRRSAPMNGVCVYNAHHISYELTNTILAPMSATSVADAFTQFEFNTLAGDEPFTFWTDKTGSGSFRVDEPKSIRAVLGGSKGSILDAFGGGEYEFDDHTVKLYQHRGADNGVTIHYGKNLTDITADIDALGLYNAVIPFWKNEDAVVYGNIVKSTGGEVLTKKWTIQDGTPITDEYGEEFYFDFIVTKVVPMDLSQEFSDKPSPAQLEARAASILISNEPWLPKENIKVDFVSLWQTEEYKDIAPLERVRLCDTVSVYYPALGVTGKKKVIKVVWNALLDRYDQIELGASSTSFADAIMAETDQKLAEVPSISMMDAAISRATELITGGLGGNIVFTQDANGYPVEMLIMDTKDINTAVNVWRWNLGGLGHSNNGYNGPFDLGITQDGQIVADFITTGTMLANRIKGGTLSLGGGTVGGNGVMMVYNSSGTMIGRWDKDGIIINSGTIRGPYIAIGGANNADGILEIYNSSNSRVGRWDNGALYIGNIASSFASPNTKIDTAGAITTKSLTANDYVYVNGNSNSLIKIPYLNTAYYSQFSNTGLECKGAYGNSVDILKIGPITSTGFGINIHPNNNIINNFAAYVSGSQPTLRLENNNRIVMMDPTNIQFYSVTRNGDTESWALNSQYGYSGFSTFGSKDRIVKTDDYGDRRLTCYETASPMFGDVGDGVIGEDGKCYVMIDSIFSETVNLSQYQVFLQKYGNGDCWVSERASAYFVVEGTPGIAFGWEIKAKQSDYDQFRLERNQQADQPYAEDLAELFINHLEELRTEREVA